MSASLGDLQRLALLQEYPLVGHCNGKFALITADADFLQTLLPDDLVLAPQDYTPAGQHPLLLMFNDTWLQSNLNLEKAAVATNSILNLHYNEFIVMLPFVKFKEPQYSDKGPYCYLPVLYLDSLLAVMGGRVFWEFNKLMAGFSVQPTEFAVTEESDGSTILSGLMLMAGFFQPEKSIPNFQKIIPILTLPVIEHGPYGYVSSIYKIAYENNTISPTGVNFNNLVSQFMPSGLSNSPAITENPLGSFLMNYDWKLSYIEFIKF